MGQELSVDCWWTAWDMPDPWCAWIHSAQVLPTLMKLGLFLSAIHFVGWKETICELGHIAGQCITVIIDPDSTTLQMLMSSSFLNCRPTSSLQPELGADWNLTFCAPGVLEAVGIPPSHHTGSRNCLVTSWSRLFMGGLCQICLLCECVSSPKPVRLRVQKQAWDSLLWQLWKGWHWPQGDRMLGDTWLKPLQQVPSTGKGMSAWLWNQNSVMEAEQKLLASVSSPAFVYFSYERSFRKPEVSKAQSKHRERHW